MSFGTFLYNAAFKRSGTMIALAVVGSLFIERGIDYAAQEIYYRKNKGKVWEDVSARLGLNESQA